MFTTDEITIGTLTGKDIADFYFLEGRLADLHEGVVTVRRVLSQTELAFMTSATINLSPRATLQRACVNEHKSVTTLYFSALPQMDKFVGTTTFAMSNKTLKSVTEKVLSTTLGVKPTLASLTNPNFTCTISLQGTGYNIVNFALSSWFFSKLREASATVTWAVTAPANRYFDLANRVNSTVAATYTATVASAITGYSADLILDDASFEAESITVYLNRRQHVSLMTKNFASRKTLSVTNINPLVLFLSYVKSDAGNDFLNHWKPWLIANYVGVKGKLKKTGIVVNIGDSVQFKEHKGIVRRIERRPNSDTIYFGFPPFPNEILYNKDEEKRLWFTA